MESNPSNEGFIILSDNQKQHLPSRSANRMKEKQTPDPRTWSNITATTTSKTIAKSSNRTSDSQLDYSAVRLGRRLLNDISYDTDIDTTPANSLHNHPSDVDDFLAVNDEELSKQLMLMAVSTDGSGYSMYCLESCL